MKKPLISKITKSSDKTDQFHGNYCLSAELDNGSTIYYHNVKYKRTLLSVNYPSGAKRTFEEEINFPIHSNFSNTKYSEVVKQILTHFKKSVC